MKDILWEKLLDHPYNESLKENQEKPSSSLASTKNTNVCFVPGVCLLQGKPQEEDLAFLYLKATEKAWELSLLFTWCCVPGYWKLLKVEQHISFHVESDLHWSPGVLCSFQTAILKSALVHVSFSISCLLAGNRKVMPSWHRILERLYIHAITVFSRNV